MIALLAFPDDNTTHREAFIVENFITSLFDRDLEFKMRDSLLSADNFLKVLHIARIVEANMKIYEKSSDRKSSNVPTV